MDRRTNPPTGSVRKKCPFFARGYCKNGGSCRFLHGPSEVATANLGEQQQQIQGPSSSSQLTGTAAPSVPSAGGCRNSLRQQQQPQQQQEEQNQRAAALAATAALQGADEHLKSLAPSTNPVSRQIYLTFPADSTFTEEDVSSYFRSKYGPVQDVMFPFQRKRVYGFVTFVHPETAKLILANGMPHSICGSTVLVKPCIEKGKVLRKYPQSVEHGSDISKGSGDDEGPSLDHVAHRGIAGVEFKALSIDHDTSSIQVHNYSLSRFLHGPTEDATANLGKQQQQQLQRPSSSSQLTGIAAPFVTSPSKWRNFLPQQQQLQQQQENQRAATLAATAALPSADEHLKNPTASTIETSEHPGLTNPVSARRIYLNFSADSTFTEDDVSSYFSKHGPVQDVIFPFQHKRVYGFVTFMHPETAKLILANGKPHFICSSRILVKPYIEKGKVLRKHPQSVKHDSDICKSSDNDKGPSLDHDTSSNKARSSTLSRLISKQPADSICKGAHIVIRGRPCKVVQIHTPRAASGDSTDFHFVGIDIFKGRKLEDIVPSSHICDVPCVDRTEYQIIYVSEDGSARLVSESGETRDDLRPPASKSEWIKNKLEQEKIKVTVMSAMGEAHICSLAVVPR